MTEAVLRDYCAGSDESLVSDSWKRSFSAGYCQLAAWTAHGQPGCRGYYTEMSSRVRRLLEEDKCIIAHNPADPDHIWGWCCFSGDCVHYVWVRSEYRKQGIAMQLLLGTELARQSKMRVTHWTAACEAMQAKLSIEYKPSFIKRRRKNEED